MHLAKPHLDIGLFCRDIDASRAFYEGRLALDYVGLLKLGGGIHQHRLGLRGGVLKLNTSRTPLPDGQPSCLRSLVVADPAVMTTGRVAWRDPDGLPVTLVPPGELGVETVRVSWASRDVGRLAQLLADGLDATPAPDGCWRVGHTLVHLVHDPDAHHGRQHSVGFRYLTVQVGDVHAEHERLVALGWQERMAPIRLGDVAAISFVSDPDGAWLEVSQRASLTGELPGD